MLLTVVSLSASSRDSAYLAQRIIGPKLWSQVVQIENPGATPDGRYPAEFHGLVIAFGDVLWLYTEYDGTQNLSSHRGQVAVDDASLETMLRAINPGWSLGKDTAEPPPAGLSPTVVPPNGCFLACLVVWQILEQSKQPPKEARLIACYAPDRTTGHMLLQYRWGPRRYVFDPGQPDKAIPLRYGMGDDALLIARTILGERWAVPPERAVPLDLVGGSPRRVSRAVTGSSAPSQPRS